MQEQVAKEPAEELTQRIAGEVFLNVAHGYARLDQVGGVAVAKRVGTDVLFDAELLTHAPQRSLNGSLRGRFFG